MTAKEWKDLVAGYHGYDSWNGVLQAFCYEPGLDKFVEALENQAMQLYAEAKCKRQRIACFDSLPMGSIYREYYEDVKNRILQTPLATDKP